MCYLTFVSFRKRVRVPLLVVPNPPREKHGNSLPLTLTRYQRESKAWRPGRISAGPQQIPSSQSAPETVQMMVAVSRQGDGRTSARSSGSSSSSAWRDDKRLPVMQLIRVKGRGSDVEDGGGDGGCDFYWRVALTASMPVLYGFCLAVVGLETGVVGASVAVVDRAVAEGQAQAAAGFLGFEKVSTPPFSIFRLGSLRFVEL